MSQAPAAVAEILIAALAACAIGRFLCGGRLNFDHPALRTVAEMALGLAAVSLLVSGLCAAGIASPPALRILNAVLVALALFFLAGNWKRAGRLPALTKIAGFGWAAGAVYATWVFLAAMLPASARDELIYHLDIPKRLLESGGAHFFQDNIYAYFPQLGERLFLLGLATAGEPAARLVHALFGGLLAAALYGLARYWMPQIYAFFAAALFLTVPSVLVTASWAYVDLIFCLYAFLSAAAWLEFFRREENKWAVAAGVFAGCAAASKYTGFQWQMLLMLLVFAEFLFSRKKNRFFAAALSVAAFLPLAALPLVRNFAETGWPFFPFSTGDWPLREGMNWDPERARLYLKWLLGYGTDLARPSVWQAALAPVLVFVTGRFDSYRFYEGIAGPVFLLAPVALWRVRKPVPVKLLAALTAFFLLYWALTTKQMRFLFPALALLSLLLAYGLSLTPFRWLKAAAVVLMLVNLFTGVKEVWKKGPLDYWQGKESRDDYLARQYDGYEIYRMTGRIVKPGERVYLVNMRNYGYYLDCPWRSDYIFERCRLDRFMETARAPEEIRDFFLEHGTRYLLIDEAFAASARTGFDTPGKKFLFGAFLKKFAQPLAQQRPYSLYVLLDRMTA
ncbi:MAG: phospholipid carrier-dependent glycosyltransferase [Candidatus Omnitrophica bacterium]|nr:phospholipid carrier-dependent glycosyltransferase [Candidatus Omnitrophota bacterium]